MKVKLNEIVSSEQALIALLNQSTMPDRPGLGFRLGMLARELGPIFDQYRKQNQELLDKYHAVPNKVTGQYEFPKAKDEEGDEVISTISEDEKSYMADYAVLVGEEVELKFKQITEADLNSVRFKPEANATPAVLGWLAWLVEEETAPPVPGEAVRPKSKGGRRSKA